MPVETTTSGDAVSSTNNGMSERNDDVAAENPTDNNMNDTFFVDDDTEENALQQWLEPPPPTGAGGKEPSVRKNLDVQFQSLKSTRKQTQKQTQTTTVMRPNGMVPQRIAQYEQQQLEQQHHHHQHQQQSYKLEGDSVLNDSSFAVFLRVRPSSDSSHTIQVSTNGQSVRTMVPTTNTESLSTTNDTHTTSNITKEYTFTSVLPETTSQHDVYQQTAQPLVEGLVQTNTNTNTHVGLGTSALLFCYGITNAGKTYTVYGSGTQKTTNKTITVPSSNANKDTTSSWGILPRTLSDLYTKVQTYSQTTQPGQRLQLSLSCLEIYNEQVYDLLVPATTTTSNNNNKVATLVRGTNALKVREARGRAFVQGLSRHDIVSSSSTSNDPTMSLEEALHLLQLAKRNRNTATNHLNDRSSRSHSICQFTLRLVKTNDKAEGDKPSSRKMGFSKAWNAPNDDEPSVDFYVVDLAGSERSKRTDAGVMRQKEASVINMSLMTLIRCLMTLRGADKVMGQHSQKTLSRHPPFRDSKLTHLLMHYWTGVQKSRTAMVVHANPAACDYDETQHVLAYASKARTIQLPINNKRDTDMDTSSRTVSYDENGRRVYKNNVNKAKTKKKAMHPSLRQKVGQLLHKLSPKRGDGGGSKRKAPVVVAANASVKRIKTTEEAKPDESSVSDETVQALQRRIKVLETELALKSSEVETLSRHNRDLEDRQDEIELQVRQELSEHMRLQITNLQNQYESDLQKLKQSQRTDSSSSSSSHTNDNTDLQAAHAAHVAQLQQDLVDRVADITRLQGALERANTKIEQLTKSKDEMKRNYELLLQDKEDTDEDVSEEEEEQEEEESKDEHDIEEEQEDDERNEVFSAKDEDVEMKVAANSDQNQNVTDFDMTNAVDSSHKDAVLLSNGIADEGGEDDDDDDEEEEDDEDGESENEEGEDGEEDDTSRRATMLKPPTMKELEESFFEAEAEVADSANENRSSSYNRENKETDLKELEQSFFEEEGADEDGVRSDGLPDTENRDSPAHSRGEIPKTTEKSTTPRRRTPFATLSANKKAESERSCDGDSSDDDNDRVWLFPKKAPKIERTTGCYQRPRGRKPKGADSWDERKGAWRRSMAFH